MPQLGWYRLRTSCQRIEPTKHDPASEMPGKGSMISHTSDFLSRSVGMQKILLILDIPAICCIIGRHETRTPRHRRGRQQLPGRQELLAASRVDTCVRPPKAKIRHRWTTPQARPTLPAMHRLEPGRLAGMDKHKRRRSAAHFAACHRAERRRSQALGRRRCRGEADP